MIVLSFLAYVFMLYGITTIVVYGNGPFGICAKWRIIARYLSDGLGELFGCPLCFSTWLGLGFSILNMWIFPLHPFTPFNIIFGTNLNILPSILVVLLDMGFSAGIVWFLTKIEDYLEKASVVYEEVEKEEAE